MGSSQQHMLGESKVSPQDAGCDTSLAMSLATSLATSLVAKADNSNAAQGSAGIENSHHNSQPSYDPARALSELDLTELTRTNKRKASDSEANEHNHNTSKRVRTGGVEDGQPKINRDNLRSLESAVHSQHDWSTKLPAEYWRFNAYLDPSNTSTVSCPQLIPSPSPSGTPLKRNYSPLPKPDTIWQVSRRAFWPQMPYPMRNKSQLEMCRLIPSKSCQFCHRREPLDQQTEMRDPWHRGPGSSNIAPVYSFSIVSCGSCLITGSIMDIDVLLSPDTPSPLLRGLAITFLTPDMNIVAAQTLQAAGASAQGRVAKVYWKRQIEEIRQVFDKVKALRYGATEEWLNGLETRRKLAQDDASRFDKWDLEGGLAELRSMCAAPRIKPRTFDAEQDPQPQTFQRQMAEQMADLKQRRRHEIQRRAALLDPPLTPELLAHMPCFQAWAEIAAPLDDYDWKLLRILLAAQQPEAERRVNGHQPIVQIAQAELTKNNEQPTIQNAGPDLQQQVNRAKIRDPRDVPNAEWYAVQGPIRAKISQYAEEVISKKWPAGKDTTKDRPQFAAEVLMHVRKRFYDEVAKNTDITRDLGYHPTIDPPEGPWTQKLTLENMKWAYDLHIRAKAEDNHKKIFFCNMCPQSKKPREFLGLVQHYAAQHTNTLSYDKGPVLWRAEWPEKPLFHPDPTAHLMGLPQSTHLKDPPPPRRDGDLLGHCRFDEEKFGDRADWMADIGCEVWQSMCSTSGKPRISELVMVSIVMDHMVRSYQGRFSEDTPLDLIRHILKTSNKTRRFARVRIHCGECEEDPLVFNHKWELPRLAEHFFLTHGAGTSQPLDWRASMIPNPGRLRIQECADKLKNTRKAMAFFSITFPWLLLQTNNDGSGQNDPWRARNRIRRTVDRDEPPFPPDSGLSVKREADETSVELVPLQPQSGSSAPEPSLQSEAHSRTEQPATGRRSFTRTPPWRQQGHYQSQQEGPIVEYRPTEQYQAYNHTQPLQPLQPQQVFQAARYPQQQHVQQYTEAPPLRYVPERTRPLQAVEYLESRDPERGTYFEIRDPERGTYYVRRPERREVYIHETRGSEGNNQARIPFQVADHERSGTMALRPTSQYQEEYDTRYPAGARPSEHIRRY